MIYQDKLSHKMHSFNFRKKTTTCGSITHISMNDVGDGNESDVTCIGCKKY